MRAVIAQWARSSHSLSVSHTLPSVVGPISCARTVSIVSKWYLLKFISTSLPLGLQKHGFHPFTGTPGMYSRSPRMHPALIKALRHFLGDMTVYPLPFTPRLARSSLGCPLLYLPPCPPHWFSTPAPCQQDRLFIDKPERDTSTLFNLVLGVHIPYLP